MSEDDLCPLYLSEKDSIAIFRALLEYDKILQYSQIADSILVHAELQRVRSIQERISLLSYYPEEQSANVA